MEHLMEGGEEMKKRFWSATIVTVLFILTVLGQASEDPTSPKEPKIPNEFAITISGRIIFPDGEPVSADRSVLLSETEPGKPSFTLRAGAGGKIINPSGRTDKNGRFTIVADRRYWEKTGYFTLEGPNGPLRLRETPIGGWVIIKVDPEMKKIDLGDLINPRPEFKF
jgi:hypothetical protein